MTIAYVNPLSGSDITGNGTEGNPWATTAYANSQLTGGQQHTIRTRRGSVQTLTATLSFKSGASPEARFVYEAYGEGAAPILRPDGVIADIAYGLSGCQYLTVRDMDFDGNATNVRPVQFQANSASIVDVLLERLICRRAAGTKPGLFLTTTVAGSVAGYSISALRVVGGDYHSNEGAGTFASGPVMASFEYVRAYRNAFGVESYGMGSVAHRTTVTSGWSGAGPVYSRAYSEATVLAVTTTHSTYRRLVQNTGTPTTPAAGEWGISGGTLYVNLGGTSPNTLSTTYAYSTCGPLIYDGCEVFENYDFPGGIVEGAGLQLDDFTVGRVLRCRAWNNQGAGISINRGSACDIFGSIATGNRRHGIVVQYSAGSTVRHCTVADNDLGGTDACEINVNSGCSSVDVANCVVVSSRPTGINFAADSLTGSTARTNCVWGPSTLISGVTPTGTLNINPNLDDSYRPTNVGLRGAGTYLGGLDFNGKEFRPAPTIGAVEYFPPRSLITRAIVSSPRTFISRRVKTRVPLRG